MTSLQRIRVILCMFTVFAIDVHCVKLVYSQPAENALFGHILTVRERVASISLSQLLC